MRFEFTPAAYRALAAAAGWASRADSDELHVPEVLLGLLSEPECRAALLLAQCGIDEQAVRGRFVEIVPVDSPDPERAARYSREWLQCLHTAHSLLADYPQPLELATEHLLLGVAAGPGEVSLWLADSGMSAEALEAEVHRLAGHERGPLPLATDDDPLGILDAELSASDEIAALRVIDAAANRAAEGLRVVEDYARFALDDAHLTGECKAIRHALAAAIDSFPASDRHAARETLADVGTELTLASEQARSDPAAVAQASFKRVEQALRSLEEYGKVIDPGVAGRFERLRYRVYTLERAVDITRESLMRLANARLCVLVDGGRNEAAFRDLVESLMAAGVAMIQLRDKSLADRELLGRARLLAALVRDSDTLFIMNDRADLAALAGADGVHVGQDDLPAKDARRTVGPRALVGVSTHSIEQARTAVLDGANYIGVGPTFPSTTKQFTAFTGLDLLEAVAREISLPAFAIGGITLDNLPQVQATGIARVAVSGAIASATDPGGVAQQMVDALAQRRS